MIHDAQVEVTCDGNACRESVFVHLHFVYGGIMHTDGRYDHSDAAVEKDLRRQEWIARDGKHYCGEGCAA